MRHEVGLYFGDVCEKSLSKFECWVIVVCACMLDKEETWRVGLLGSSGTSILCDAGIKDGLEVVVTMVLDVVGIEDSRDVLDRF